MDNTANNQETQQVRYSKLYYFAHRPMKLSEIQLANAATESGLDAATLNKAYAALEKCIDPETKLASDAIVAEGFVDYVSQDYENERGKYCYFDIAVTMADRTVTTNFGEKFVRQNHKVIFTVAYGGDKLDAIRRIGIDKGDKVQFAAYNLEVKDNTSSDGRVFLKIGGYSIGGLSLVAKSKLNADAGQSANSAQVPAQTNAPAPQQTVQSSGQKCDNASCGYTVSEAEKGFCLKNSARFGGKVYCRKCQQALFSSGAQQTAPAPQQYQEPLMPQFQDLTATGVDGECPF